VVMSIHPIGPNGIPMPLKKLEMGVNRL